MSRLNQSNSMRPAVALAPMSGLMSGLATILAAALLVLALQPLALAKAPAPVLELQPDQVEALGVRAENVAFDGDGSDAGTGLRYPATIVVPSNRQRAVAAPVAGLVTGLKVAVGDTVKAGDALAVLQSASVQQMQRELLSAGSQSTLASATAKRDAQLFDEGLIARSRLEASRAAAAQARLLVDGLRGSLGFADAASGKADGLAIVKSPIDGVVLERSVVDGQRVDTADALFRIAALAPLWVEMQVPAGVAATARPGDAVVVSALDGAPARATVIAVAQTVDPASQSVMVRAELQAPPAGMRIGLAVGAALESARAGVARLPAAAIVEVGGERVVFVERGEGRYEARVVEPLGAGGGVASVRGLPEGARVVVQGTAALKALLATRGG